MRGMRLFSLSGIDVCVDWSLLIVFVVITMSLGGGLFPSWHPQWTPTQSWLLALVAAVLFFASVLLHELSHALVGRRYGITVRRIVLFVFGGMAQIEHEPGRWGAELAMAIVGPITSLVIGIACLLSVGDTGAFDAAPSPAELPAALAALGPLPTLLVWLGQLNLVLAIFNLVPAFPLDGGRVLHALLWRFSGDLHRATRTAAAIGQGFGWLLMAAGGAMIFGIRVPFFGVGPASGIWIAFIGWFLNTAAVMSYRQLKSPTPSR
jgi:Zn-dependent protease